MKTLTLPDLIERYETLSLVARQAVTRMAAPVDEKACVLQALSIGDAIVDAVLVERMKGKPETDQ